MSHQPTTLDQLKTTASNTATSLTNTLNKETNPDYNPNNDPENFSKDGMGNKFKKGDMKDALNEAALVHRKSGEEEEGKGVVGKVLEYIPGFKSTTQQKGEEERERVEKEKEGRETPPRRPEHDVQVEQFLRGQYHSKNGEGMPDGGK
ncbi:hypothetical protein HYFRA_00006052 [Hymenoscyphus fraxineus]|uniref:Uncharacterized protein n=1 Tax=Hymenoscyphus fraxineus TaxID=746836 RepID=A0A9N9PSR2_9HELO|nr:hypothetical protein HYFRA_00006052 [Hymenoscyphus fraxineus]